MSADLTKLSLTQIAELGKKCKAITDAATGSANAKDKKKTTAASHKKTAPEPAVKYQPAPPCITTVLPDANATIKKSKKKEPVK